jgi:paraquat-inducible protein A
MNLPPAQASNRTHRIACRDCGLIQEVPQIPARHVVECGRCGRVLISRTVGRVDRPLALAMAALFLLVPAILAPLLSVSTLGAARESGLLSGVRVFASQGFPELGTLVLLCAVVLPFAFLLALVAVLGSIHFGITHSRGLGRLYRWVGLMRPWMMIEVFLVGGFVAYTRIQAVAAVDVDAGGWFLLASTFATLFALTQLDDRTVWDALTLRGTTGHDPGTARNNDERKLPTIACTACDLIVPADSGRDDCPRCHASLHARKPNSLPRTAALLIAGYLLYVPANLLPVITVVSVGDEERNTIMSGVFELIHNDLWPLAAIVFIASIVLPLMKLVGLTWMLIAIRLRSSHLLRARTRLFRTIELIGRWSNIDVFMGSVLVALLQFGALTSVRAEPGLVAFAAVVVITMIATETFDARLMWDAAAESAA